MDDIIKIAKKKLVVPNTPTIPYIEGDGIGVDITRPTIRLINAAVEKVYRGKRGIAWKKVLAGQEAFDKKNQWLPSDTIDAFKKYRVGLKGPLQTPVGGGIRSLNVALRQKLDLYVCLRPVRWFKGVPSPVRHPELVDMHIFRENTEDIYAGIEYMTGTPEAEKVRNFFLNEMGVESVRFPESSSFGVKPVSKDGSERLVRAAIKYAIERKLPSVTLVHKGNIMKFTEGAFKNWGYDLAESEFGKDIFSWRKFDKIKKDDGIEAANRALAKAKKQGKVILKDVITDAFLQETLLHPYDYSVIATMNLNGDYVSDQLAAMVGGIGISPGANVNYRKGYAIFEATHGTAPNIVGTGKANPSSLILSAVMMLEYMGWNEAADDVLFALEKTLSERKVTADLYGMMEGAELYSTNDFVNQIIENLY